MTERQLQFRVGLLVIVAAAGFVVMVFQFGELRNLWEATYTVAVRFESAPGVRPSTPVERNGISIGRVREVVLDEERGGVIVRAEIRRQYALRDDVEPRIVQSLLGDASIVIAPGSSPNYVADGGELRGHAPVSPMDTIHRLEENVSQTLDTFEKTSSDWRRVAQNLNGLMETNRGNLDAVIERTAEALIEFSAAMQQAQTALGHANRVLGDPRQQEALQRTLTALPELVDDTRRTIAAVRSAVGHVDGNLKSLNDITAPLAAKSQTMADDFESTLKNLQVVTAELSQFARLLNREEGSLKKFASEPDLYRNLNRSALMLSMLLENLHPIARDLSVFSDKIARHPELIGVRGALRGSSGLKDPPPEEFETIRPASGIRRE